MMMMMMILLPLIIIQHSIPGGFLGQELYSTHWINATSNGQRACENFTTWLKTVKKRFYPQCYWIAGILQVEKGSFLNMSDIKQNTLLKGKLESRQGQPARGAVL